MSGRGNGDRLQRPEIGPGDLLSVFTQDKGTGELPNPAIMFPAMTGRDRS